MRAAFDWLHSRTGFRGARQALLDEPLPPGTGWFFTLGSVLLALLGIQLLTGAFLTLYYAPTPGHAYDSVRFIVSTTPGRIVRGLHHYGSSFLIVALVLHMLRVIAFGSYKAPREATWLSGLALFALILGFSLTGYLLPWDQRAYWATVVTINIAKLTPLAGELVAGLLRGGASIGALTLTRWYAVHVIFLPGALVGLVVLHLVLMRRHGISGPVRPHDGTPTPFYPWQAARDTAVVSVVVVALAALAWSGAPSLEGPADPADGTYIPRPEWYFLGLFQLLKYFPGQWEVVGAMVVPGLAAAFLALLPWLDRGPVRDPRRRPAVMIVVMLGVAAVSTLTILGFRDAPASAPRGDVWTLREIGGRVLANAGGCATCHAPDGRADPLEGMTPGRGAEWITGHVQDPEMIVPGLREPPVERGEREIAALLAYVHKSARQPYPGFPAPIETAAAVFAQRCIGCHVIDGDGGTDGPDLSNVGTKHDAGFLRRLIADPEAVNPKAEMPSFERRLSADQLDAIAAYLASRK
ncbi:MAG TPA: cytochrome b N-terminal domain-containing protein [Plantibacter sp.]|uniref:cytochrome b N-terminal domain-containing protein n=1 Tax=Plantibacter sp. TaxID=1871045 RepID=UPI002CB86348|nr:cytochrome b N-terminal domain-containing protein [Plantibacter sp.]